MTFPAATPKPDRVYGGQFYWLVRTDPHRCRDGRDTVLDVYRTHCAACGTSFETKSPAGSIGALSRRCAEHRRPGIKA